MCVETATTDTTDTIKFPIVSVVMFMIYMVFLTTDITDTNSPIRARARVMHKLNNKDESLACICSGVSGVRCVNAGICAGFAFLSWVSGVSGVSVICL